MAKAEPCCRTCAFVLFAEAKPGGTEKDREVAAVSGWCHANPPTVFKTETGMSSAFPPVHLDGGWCGLHKPAPRQRLRKEEH
jgi:hypothetical protein